MCDNIQLMGGIRLAIISALAVLGANTANADAKIQYLQDNFGGSGERYFFEGELEQRYFRYVEGKYEIDTTGGESYGQSILVDDLSNYRLEVKAQMIQGGRENGGFGLSYNYRQGIEGNDFLLFLVYDRGAFTVLRYFKGQTSVLYSPTKTKLFSPGEEVLLTVNAAGGSSTFYINSVEVARVRDDSLPSGGFGMFSTAGAIVRFDDLVVMAEKTTEKNDEDSFEGEQQLFSGNWGEVDYTYENGGYVIDTTNTEFIGLSPFPSEAVNFEFSVDVELLEGEPIGGFGIYARDHTNDLGGFDQYRFLVSEDWFAVERSTGMMPLALAQWERHPAVRSRGVNRLRIKLSGSQLSFFVNGVETWSGEDPSPHIGSYGFFVSGGLKIFFDNVMFMAQ